MTATIGLKLLRADGSSLRENGRVMYRPDLKPGEWQTIPGHGAYVAVSGGLTAGGIGPVLAVLECDPTSRTSHDGTMEGVQTYTRVRWWREWTPTTDQERIADAAWSLAYAAYSRAYAAMSRAYVPLVCAIQSRVDAAIAKAEGKEE